MNEEDFKYVFKPGQIVYFNHGKQSMVILEVGNYHYHSGSILCLVYHNIRGIEYVQFPIGTTLL